MASGIFHEVSKWKISTSKIRTNVNQVILLNCTTSDKIRAKQPIDFEHSKEQIFDKLKRKEHYAQLIE